MRRQPEATGRRAEPTRRSGDPEAGPNRPDPKRRQAASGAPVSAAPAAAAGRGRQSGSTPARGAGKTGASPVVQDIAGTADTTRRTAEPPEEVTDVIAPVEQTKRPGRGRGKTGDWPTTDTATPEAVGAPKRTRLAESKLRKHRKARMAGRAALAISAAVALLITGGGWSYLRASGNGFTQVSALGDNSEDVIDGNAQLGDENYLIVGTDTRAGANGKLGAGTIEDAEGARADTVLLVHVPKNRQRVVVVSFPRDLDVSRPECKGWDNAKNDYTEETYEPFIGDKLNAVYALGGPRCLVSTIQRLTGSTINHFIGIDFAGFEAMVDQVGGVQVCTTEPLIDGELGTVLEKPGKQIINGATALNYVRARKVYGEIRGDYDRINRQQKFLASLLRTALSSKVLLDLGKLNGFIKAFTQATFVDKVKPDDLLTLGRSLADVNAGAVTFLTIPTSGTNAYGNEIPRESDIKAIFKAIRDDRPLPGEKPGAAAPTPAETPTPPVPPSNVAVDPSTGSRLVRPRTARAPPPRPAKLAPGRAGGRGVRAKTGARNPPPIPHHAHLHADPPPPATAGREAGRGRADPGRYAHTPRAALLRRRGPEHRVAAGLQWLRDQRPSRHRSQQAEQCGLPDLQHRQLHRRHHRFHHRAVRGGLRDGGGNGCQRDPWCDHVARRRRRARRHHRGRARHRLPGRDQRTGRRRRGNHRYRGRTVEPHPDRAARGSRAHQRRRRHLRLTRPRHFTRCS